MGCSQEQLHAQRLVPSYDDVLVLKLHHDDGGFAQGKSASSAVLYQKPHQK